jgi:hypothetical protein
MATDMDIEMDLDIGFMEDDAPGIEVIPDVEILVSPYQQMHSC